MKTAVVTGGSSGLGEAICKRFWLEGYEVLNIDIEPPAPDNMFATRRYNWLECDVRNEKELKKALNYAKKCDILVNNAGINHLNYLEDLEYNDFDKVIKTNVYGYYLVARTFLPLLKKSKGTIVNIVSRSAKMPMTASLAYNASKGAQLIMTKQMARELTRKYGITVFAISPNRLKGTGMTKYIDETVPEVRGWTKEYAEKYQKKNTLVKEETEPELIAKRVVGILEDDHEFLSGSNLEFGI